MSVILRRSLIATVLTAAIVAGPLAAARAEGSVVIRTFAGNDPAPVETISVPLAAVAIAARLVPSGLRSELEADGISLEEIGALAQQEGLEGVLATIEDAAAGERVVIAIERQGGAE